MADVTNDPVLTAFDTILAEKASLQAELVSLQQKYARLERERTAFTEIMASRLSEQAAEIDDLKELLLKATRQNVALKAKSVSMSPPSTVSVDKIEKAIELKVEAPKAELARPKSKLVAPRASGLPAPKSTLTASKPTGLPKLKGNLPVSRLQAPKKY